MNYNLSNNRNEENNKAMREAVSMSAYKRADNVLKYANNQGYVDQDEIDAARYALGLRAEPGDRIVVGKWSYELVSVEGDLITMRSPKLHDYRAETEYTIRWRAKGEPKPKAEAPKAEAPKVVKLELPKAEEVKVEQPRVEEPKPSNDLELALKILGSYAKGGNNPELEARVAAIEANFEALKKNVCNGPSFTVKLGELPERKIEGVMHPKMLNVLKAAQRRKPVYLYGPAGAGKTVCAMQVAKALGLKFYCTGALLHKHEIEGFLNASGQYMETGLYKAFTQGGVYLFDEMDASTVEAVLAFARVLANRSYTFPGQTEEVQAHPDFIIIAAGNSNMNGSDEKYKRENFDKSIPNRFKGVKFNYSREIELSETGDEALVDFGWELRRVFNEQSVWIDYSVRNMKSALEDVADGLNHDEAMLQSVGWQLDREQARMIAAALSADNVWAEAFKKMARNFDNY